MDGIKAFIGWDDRERNAWNVASWSLCYNASVAVSVEPLNADRLVRDGMYKRETILKGNSLWDVISEAPMSTSHAIARFFVPHLMNHEGWALFMDGDILVRHDIAELLALADPKYAVMVVKHDYQPKKKRKKDGAVQTTYERKNWSSVMLWNTNHVAHQSLTLGKLNNLPGRDLHRFVWLQDSEIGELPEKWNWLVGHSSPDIDPGIVHFTEGLPDRAGYSKVPFADHWWHVYNKVMEYPPLTHLQGWVHHKG